MSEENEVHDPFWVLIHLGLILLPYALLLLAIIFAPEAPHD